MAKKTTIYCYDCEKDTNHEILFSKKTKEADTSFDESNNKIDIIRNSTYQIVQCLGCDTHSFVEKVSYSNDKDNDGIPIVNIAIYPKSEEFQNEENNGFYLQGEEMKVLPLLVRRLYIELVSAFRNDLDILAGMGLRSLIEAVCVHKNIGGRNLELKIENLFKAGYISQKEMPILQKLRQIGNSTVHTIEKPPAKLLDNALEIINHTLKTVYYLPKVDAKIKKGSKFKKN